MNVIASLIDETEEYDWEQVTHEVTLKNVLSGEKLIQANDTPYFQFIKMENSRRYHALVQSTAKLGAAAYTPITETVNAGRLMLKGALILEHMSPHFTKEMKFPEHTPVQISTRHRKEPVSILFWSEMDGVRYDSSYGWRVEVKGKTYGGSLTITEHDAFILLLLGKPIHSYAKKETEKRFKQLKKELKKG